MCRAGAAWGPLSRAAGEGGERAARAGRGREAKQTDPRFASARAPSPAARERGSAGGAIALIVKGRGAAGMLRRRGCEAIFQLNSDC
jgi:hypothetical protein